MEDPFLPGSILDGGDVTKELLDNLQPKFLNLRVQFFPDAASSSSLKTTTTEKSSIVEIASNAFYWYSTEPLSTKQTYLGFSRVE